LFFTIFAALPPLQAAIVNLIYPLIHGSDHFPSQI
jgi:hypothetical protein